ncbi:MAG: hypothetical protein KGH64_00765 [Candidatus Micrarchaeota archaeon]|nr:hypothetical protein [Candidatus Micrarchaeota archaeon]
MPARNVNRVGIPSRGVNSSGASAAAIAAQQGSQPSAATATVGQQAGTPTPSLYINRQVETQFGNVNVQFKAQPASRGQVTYAPVRILSNTQFTQPINQTSGPFTTTGSNVFTFSLQGGQLVPTLVTQNGQVTYNGVVVANIVNGQPVATGNTISQPIQGSIGGQQQNVGTITYAPVVSNGTISLAYQSFRPANVEYNTSRYVEQFVAGRNVNTKVGLSISGTTSYNQQTGQISVNFPQYAGGLLPNVTIPVEAPATFSVAGQQIAAPTLQNVSVNLLTGQQGSSTTGGFVNLQGKVVPTLTLQNGNQNLNFSVSAGTPTLSGGPQTATVKIGTGNVNIIETTNSAGQNIFSFAANQPQGYSVVSLSLAQGQGLYGLNFNIGGVAQSGFINPYTGIVSYSPTQNQNGPIQTPSAFSNLPKNSELVTQLGGGKQVIYENIGAGNILSYTPGPATGSTSSVASNLVASFPLFNPSGKIAYIPGSKPGQPTTGFPSLITSQTFNLPSGSQSINYLPNQTPTGNIAKLITGYTSTQSQLVSNPSRSSTPTTQTAQETAIFGLPSGIGGKALTVGLIGTPIVIGTGAALVLAPEAVGFFGQGIGATILGGAVSNAVISVGFTEATSIIGRGTPVVAPREIAQSAAEGAVAGGAFGAAGIGVSRFLSARVFPLVNTEVVAVSFVGERSEQGGIEILTPSGLAGVRTLNEEGAVRATIRNTFKNAVTGKLSYQYADVSGNIANLRQSAMEIGKPFDLGLSKTISSGTRPSATLTEKYRPQYGFSVLSNGKVIVSKNGGKVIREFEINTPQITISEQTAGSRQVRFITGSVKPSEALINPNNGQAELVSLQGIRTQESRNKGTISKVFRINAKSTITKPESAGVAISKDFYTKIPGIGKVTITKSIGRGVSNKGVPIEIRASSIKPGQEIISAGTVGSKPKTIPGLPPGSEGGESAAGTANKNTLFEKYEPNGKLVLVEDNNGFLTYQRVPGGITSFSPKPPEQLLFTPPQQATRFVYEGGQSLAVGGSAAGSGLGRIGNLATIQQNGQASRFSSISAFQLGSSQGLRISQYSVSASSQGVGSRLFQSSASSQAQGAKVTQISAQASAQKQGLRTVQTTAQALSTKQLQQQSQRQQQSAASINVSSFVNTKEKFNSPFLAGPKPPTRASAKSFTKYAQKFGYVPDLTSSSLGITAPSSKKGVYKASGLLRPIIRGGKRGARK